MATLKSAEAGTDLVLALAGVNQSMRALVIEGKPLPLARQIMGAANEAERVGLLTDAVHVCAVALKTRVITDTKANLRMRQIIALDASDDNEALLKAFCRLEESDPTGCEAVVSSLSARTILSLAQPDTALAAFIVENATPKQLASAANTIAGTVFVSERRQREAERKQSLFGKDQPIRNISDDPELNHSRQKFVRRKLGQFLDLIAEAGDEPLGRFAGALTRYQHESDKPSSLFDTILQLAFKDGRESAIDVINALPDTPETTTIKIKLGLQEE